MGIVGIPRQIHVIGCTHIRIPKAFWNSKNDGSEPPDLWFDGFPGKGRMIMTGNTIVIACWECRSQLDQIVADYGKALL
jgi:hypothetical protein